MVLVVSPPTQGDVTNVTSHTAVKLQSRTLLMISQVIASSLTRSVVQAGALLDTGSAASFLSERLAVSLNLHRARQSITIS